MNVDPPRTLPFFSVLSPQLINLELYSWQCWYQKIRYIIIEVAEYTVYNHIIIHNPWNSRSYIPCLSLLVCIWSFFGNFIVPFLGRQPLLHASWNLTAHIAVCICLCPLPCTFPLRSAMQIEICQGVVVLQALQTMSLRSIQISIFFLFFCSHFLFLDNCMLSIKLRTMRSSIARPLRRAKITGTFGLTVGARILWADSTKACLCPRSLRWRCWYSFDQKVGWLLWLASEGIQISPEVQAHVRVLPNAANLHIPALCPATPVDFLPLQDSHALVRTV